MLKFFFNKESKVVYAMEALGVIFLIALVVTWWPSGKSVSQQTAFFLYIILYLFMRFCTIAKWYDTNGRNTLIPPALSTKHETQDTRHEKHPGIELHFKKVMVPTSYILAIFSLFLLIGAPGFMLYFADFLLVIIAHVNMILIYFHVKDKETVPVNYFSHNKYLE